MAYATRPVDATPAGARLAHALRPDGGPNLRKGHALSAEDLAALAAAGITELTAITLDPGHVWEEAAADQLAAHLFAAGQALGLKAAPGGRINAIAQAPGLLEIDPATVHRFNALSESLTLATVAERSLVDPGQIVATLKVIPFQVPEAAVAAGERLLAANPPLALYPWRVDLRLRLIQTALPTTAAKVLDKTHQVVAERLARLGVAAPVETRTAHSRDALAATIRALPPHDLLLIIGASAITDRADVIPAALEATGGTVSHFGMPVDPGNLLLLGERAGVPVIGLPGCARSPARNGFDWVLERLVAGRPVSGADIQAMGVGGLLKDTPARGITRAEPAAPRPPKVVPLILAAGQGTRMGGPNKLLLPWTSDGRPVVARVAALAAGSASDGGGGLVVLGYQAAEVAGALADFPHLKPVINPHYAEGQATSLRAGLAALPDDADGALVLLGDMPLVRPETLQALINAFDPLAGRALIHPAYQGRRGNPMIIGRRFFAELAAELTGDTGARGLLQRYPAQVHAVAVADPGVLQDLDTPDAYEAARATVAG